MDGDAPLHDEQPTNNPMTVSFRDANGAAVDFKMKASTKLGKAWPLSRIRSAVIRCSCASCLMGRELQRRIRRPR